MAWETGLASGRGAATAMGRLASRRKNSAGGFGMIKAWSFWLGFSDAGVAGVSLDLTTPNESTLAVTATEAALLIPRRCLFTQSVGFLGISVLFIN